MKMRKSYFQYIYFYFFSCYKFYLIYTNYFVINFCRKIKAISFAKILRFLIYQRMMNIFG